MQHKYRKENNFFKPNNSVKSFLIAMFHYKQDFTSVKYGVLR